MKKRGPLKSKPKKVSYKDKKSAKETVKKLNNMPRSEARILANTLSNRAKFHQNKTKEMSEAQKEIDNWRAKERKKDEKVKKSLERVEKLRKDLRRWVKEKWTAQNGQPCGAYTGKGKVKCRPSKKVSSNTPKTWGEMDKKEKKKAVRVKQKAHKEGKQFSNHRTGKTYDSKGNKYTKSLATQERHKKKAKNMKKTAREEMIEVLEKGRCWEGYKPVSGKSEHEKGSCEPISKKDIQVAPEGSTNRKTYKDEFEKATEVVKYDSNGQWSLEKMGPLAGAVATGIASGVAGSVTDSIMDKAEDKKKDEKEHDKKDIKKSAREEMIEELEKAKKSSKPFHGYSKKKHSTKGGLSESYRKKYNRETGSNLQKPVTSKEAKSSKKKAGRRKSFCARMSGVKGPTSKDGKLTRKGAALKRWDC